MEPAGSHYMFVFYMLLHIQMHIHTHTPTHIYVHNNNKVKESMHLRVGGIQDGLEERDLGGCGEREGGEWHNSILTKNA